MRVSENGRGRWWIFVLSGQGDTRDRRAKRLSRGAGPRGVALPARAQRIRSGEDGGADARLAIELAADRAARRRTQRAQDARGAASSRGLVTLNRR